MGVKFPEIIPKAKGVMRQKSCYFSSGQLPSNPAATTEYVPKGHLAIYVGLQYKTRFLVPISYLKQSKFLDLLKAAEEEYGFDHAMGGLTLPCSEEAFLYVHNYIAKLGRQLSLVNSQPLQLKTFTGISFGMVMPILILHGPYHNKCMLEAAFANYYAAGR